MKSPASAGAESSRVLVAMSGGVDSSVAAALLHEAGCQVIGVTLHLWDAEGAQRVGRCCAPEDRDDARRTCDLLGVPHYVIDERDAFRRQVVDPFVVDNLAGRTPAPCVACNQQVKLGRLWQLAQELGASCVATGHYARTDHAADGSVRLLRGADPDKDQSYFLFGVPPEVMGRLVFPLGAMTKQEARGHARRLCLPNWNKPDSQELCFVPDRDVRGFIGRQRPSAGVAGPILSTDGRLLGHHEGIEGFTVGQRRGLRVSADKPLYVLRVLPEQAAVIVGTEADLQTTELHADTARWLVPKPAQAFEADVRIRHRHHAARATVTPTADGFRVRFAAPQRAVAPGQAAVLYRGDQVLGGGFIDSTANA